MAARLQPEPYSRGRSAALPVRDVPRGDVKPSLALPEIGRWSDNELILFFGEQRESWIVYPPRSAYDFVQRPSHDAAVVEFHPWEPLAVADQHPVRPRDGCVLHGLQCRASAAIQAAVDTGFDPFK